MGNINEQIAKAVEEIRQLQNCKKKLLNQKKAEERKIQADQVLQVILRKQQAVSYLSWNRWKNTAVRIWTGLTRTAGFPVNMTIRRRGRWILWHPLFQLGNPMTLFLSDVPFGVCQAEYFNEKRMKEWYNFYMF